MLDKDIDLAKDVLPRCQNQLKVLIKKQRQYKDDEKVMKLVLRINDLINVHSKIQDKKYEVFDFKVELSNEEKQRLDEGVQVELLFEDKLYKRVNVKLNFVKMEFEISNLQFVDSISGLESDKLKFKLKSIKSVDRWEKNELDLFESKFKMYFRKGMDKNLFFNLKYWIMTEDDLKSRTVYLIFENQFQCQAWKNLFLMLKE